MVGYLKGMGDAKGLERGESKMGGVVGRLCSSEWGKEFEALGI